MSEAATVISRGCTLRSTPTTWRARLRPGVSRGTRRTSEMRWGGPLHWRTRSARARPSTAERDRDARQDQSEADHRETRSERRRAGVRAGQNQPRVVRLVIDLKQATADRCPRALGTFVKASEVQYHHEVYNQFLWNMF